MRKLTPLSWDERYYCGPVALASVFGIPLEEAELLLRRVSGKKRRVVSTNTISILKACRLLLRRERIWGAAFMIELCPRNKRHRPHVREEHEVTQLTRHYAHRGWVPIMIVSGTQKKFSHIMAYDHKRKLLCDTFTGGKVVALQAHPLKHAYLWCVIMVPKEFVNGRH